MFGEHRGMAAAKAFSRSAKPVTPERVTTDGHDSYPPAILNELGKDVLHQDNIARIKTNANYGLRFDPHDSISVRFFSTTGVPNGYDIGTVLQNNIDSRWLDTNRRTFIDYHDRRPVQCW
jgi:hypothetical protein